MSKGPATLGYTQFGFGMPLVRFSGMRKWMAVMVEFQKPEEKR
jgi:hypothetical protein